jgi:hypothetical protein
MYYTSATQVSGIVPSATPVRTGSPILSTLPINGHGAQGVAGVGFQIAGVVDNRFTATGLDGGLFTVFTSTGPVVKVQ